MESLFGNFDQESPKILSFWQMTRERFESQKDDSISALGRRMEEEYLEPRRFRESDSQGVGSLHFFQPETPELAPLPRFRDSRSLRLHGTKMTKF